MSVDVPENLEEKVREAALKRKMSVEAFVAMALSDKASSVLGDPMLDLRASRADGRGWKLLDKVPPHSPVKGDEFGEN